MFDSSFAFLNLYSLNPVWFEFPSEQWILTAVLLFFSGILLLEIGTIHRDQTGKSLIKSYRTNITTFLFNDIVMSVLSMSSLLLIADHYNDNGLLSDRSLLIKTMASFILLDLILYLWHRANHQFDFLWIFHKVHHSDRSMNVTTAFRVHLFDLIVTTSLKALFILFMGVDAIIVGLSEGVTTLFTMYHHSRLSVPGDKWMKWLFIVPSLHRTHHSVKREEHDNNYGAILSVWDRIFGTLSESQPQEVGLKDIEEKSFLELLKYGFTNPVPKSESVFFPDMSSMIAEAAYYKAEKRGFAPGWDLHDWLEAEEETMRLLA